MESGAGPEVALKYQERGKNGRELVGLICPDPPSHGDTEALTRKEGELKEIEIRKKEIGLRPSREEDHEAGRPRAHGSEERRWWRSKKGMGEEE
jgi:hypothetical protein